MKSETEGRVWTLWTGEWSKESFGRIGSSCSRTRRSRSHTRSTESTRRSAKEPYLFHLATLSVSRQADPAYPSLARHEILEHRRDDGAGEGRHQADAQVAGDGAAQ